jgi:hypothetical protein
MSEPVEMILFCPRCLHQHIDEPNEVTGWTNPPHKSHECQNCKHVWRPADVYTNGVKEIKTKGKVDGYALPQLVPIISYEEQCQIVRKILGYDI